MSPYLFINLTGTSMRALPSSQTCLALPGEAGTQTPGKRCARDGAEGGAVRVRVPLDVPGKIPGGRGRSQKGRDARSRAVRCCCARHASLRRGGREGVGMSTDIQDHFLDISRLLTFNFRRTNGRVDQRQIACLAHWPPECRKSVSAQTKKRTSRTSSVLTHNLLQQIQGVQISTRPLPFFCPMSLLLCRAASKATNAKP